MKRLLLFLQNFVSYLACTEVQQTAGCGAQSAAVKQLAQSACEVIMNDPVFSPCHQVRHIP